MTQDKSFIMNVFCIIIPSLGIKAHEKTNSRKKI